MIRWLSTHLRRVLAALELVADDRHLGEQVLALDEAVDQPVGLQLDGEFEVLVGGRQRLEVVGAVEPGGAVELGAVVLAAPWECRGCVGVPLKTMCSSRWAMPVSP